MSKSIKGFKAFDKDLKCRGYQFELNKDFKTDKAVICQEGFHFCENPLDLFSYYSPAESKFAEVEGKGEIVTHNEDSKVACTELHIEAEVNINALIKAGVDFIFSKVKKTKSKKAHKTEEKSLASNTGDYSAASNAGDSSVASNTGDYSAASNTGDYSAASNTGNRSAVSNTGYSSVASNTGNRSAVSNTGYSSVASVSGKQSIACGLGVENKAKGALSCWLVLTEWHKINDELQIKNCQAKLVDGKIIKADTWYMLKDGEFVEI